MTQRLLFQCTGNSCRSQMAEGWARHLRGDVLDVASAGIEAHGLNPRAVAVMAEVGVDISAHRSRTLEDLSGKPFDVIVTVCDSAAENCPMVPGPARVVHQPFDDPPRLAATAPSEAEALASYRRVRDEIRVYIETLPQSLPI